MPDQNVLIEGPSGQIETVIQEVENAASAVLVCHPHPLYGGTMDNKVVTTLAQGFMRLGHSAVRFNYRGVGDSEGKFDDSRGEVFDALAVARYAMDTLGVSKLFLAGFSFGAYIAAKTALELEQVGVSVGGVLLVAPSVVHSPFADITPFHLANGQPVVVVMGDADEVVPFEDVSAWANGHGHAFNWIRLPGVTHFFHRNLVPLREAVMGAFPRAEQC